MTIREAFEKYEVLHRSLTINPFEEFGTLQAGEHRFAWGFVVPANSACASQPLDNLAKAPTTRPKADVMRATQTPRAPGRLSQRDGRDSQHPSPRTRWDSRRKDRV